MSLKKSLKKENNFINEIDLNISKKVTQFQKYIQTISEKYIVIILNL